MNPIVLLVGGAAVALVAILAVVLWPSGGDNLPYVRKQVEKKSTEGNRLYKANRFEEAIKVWKEGVVICEGDHAAALKNDRKGLEESIGRAEEAMVVRASAKEDWEALKSEYEGEEYDPFEFLKRAKALLKRQEPLKPDWIVASAGKMVGELPEMIERVNNQVDDLLSGDKDRRFEPTRKKIKGKFLERDKEDFSSAFKEWSEYLADSRVRERDKTKAKQEVERLNRLANGAWRNLSRKAEGKSKASAIEFLKENLPGSRAAFSRGLIWARKSRRRSPLSGGRNFWILPGIPL